MHTCNNTRYWGKILYYFEEINSTHDIACRMASKNRPIEGTVILADYQTSGRGQREKIWHSSSGCNLLFSSILYPNQLMIDHAFLINGVVSLAIIKTLKEFIPSSDFKIKWPNDIYFRSQKIAGILVQTSLRASHIDHVVLSIGLNVNEHTWPNEINGTSMSTILGHTLNRQEVFNKLCRRLELEYAKLIHQKTEEIMQSYNEFLYRKNKIIEIQLNQKWEKEKLMAVTSNGSLVTQCMDTLQLRQHPFRLSAVKF